jgi:hypothetical protein
MFLISDLFACFHLSLSLPIVTAVRHSNGSHPSVGLIMLGKKMPLLI